MGCNIQHLKKDYPGVLFSIFQCLSLSGIVVITFSVTSLSLTTCICEQTEFILTSVTRSRTIVPTGRNISTSSNIYIQLFDYSLYYSQVQQQHCRLSLGLPLLYEKSFKVCFKLLNLRWLITLFLQMKFSRLVSTVSQFVLGLVLFHTTEVFVPVILAICCTLT